MTQNGTHRGTAAVVAAWSALTLVGTPAPAAPQPTLRYELIDLGTLGGDESQALAMNESGTVVGWAQNGRETHAFSWTEGVMTDLGTLGGDWSQAVGVNGRGQVIGVSSTRGGEVHAFIWAGNRMQDLNQFIRWSPGREDVPVSPGLGGVAPVPAMTLFSVAAINEYGRIVGTGQVRGDEYPHGFMLVPRSAGRTATEYYDAIDLGALPGFQGCTPYCINDSDVVVGVSGNMAFQWARGVMTPLDLFTRTVVFESRATGINNLGLAVGWYVEGGLDPHEACMWSGGQHFPLDSGGGFFYEATGVNDLQQIVGWVFMQNGPVAVLWDGRECTDLNEVTAIPVSRPGGLPMFPWSHLVTATAVDESGWIAGYGQSSDGRWRAFLLKPIQVADG